MGSDENVWIYISKDQSAHGCINEWCMMQGLRGQWWGCHFWVYGLGGKPEDGSALKIQRSGRGSRYEAFTEATLTWWKILLHRHKWEAAQVRLVWTSRGTPLKTFWSWKSPDSRDNLTQMHSKKLQAWINDWDYLNCTQTTAEGFVEWIKV